MYTLKTKSSITTLVLLSFLIALPNIVSAAEGWKGDIGVGYNQSNGNTEKSSLSVAGHVKRIFEHSDFMLKGDIYMSTTDERLDDQKWSGLASSNFDIDDAGKWFASFGILIDHDRFADIDVRITPSAGIGYWFLDEDDIKLNVEGALGYESTSYRSGIPDEDGVVALGKVFFEKQIFEKARIAEHITVIPSLEGGGFRVKSETEFTNPLRDDLDLSVKYVVDHNSEPAAGKKKTDTRIVTGVKYSF